MNGIVYSSLGVMMAAVLLTACGREDRPSAEKEGVETVLPAEVNEVSVMTLKKGDFNHELVSNGKVEARAYADLNFRLTSEPVARVYVKNGDRVKKGQKLAELSLESVPENVMKLARVRSGYEQSRANYELARYELQQAVLTAPFDGVVANLFGKQYNRPDGAEPFCRIIATAGMEVEFSVLESELPLIRRGDEVDVSPYAATVAARKGRVTEINPLVDENGMVRVKAQVDGGSQLFDGMNVRVTVKRRVPGQLVVPKTAVVLRSGRQVVFTLREGKAQWNYVQTGLENMTEYTVTGDGLEEGAQVIVTGNVNLAHETPVRVVGQKK